MTQTLELFELDTTTEPTTRMYVHLADTLRPIDLIPGIKTLHEQMEALGTENPDATLDEYIAIATSTLAQKGNEDILPEDAIDAMKLHAKEPLIRESYQEFVSAHGRKPIAGTSDLQTVLELQQARLDELREHLSLEHGRLSAQMTATQKAVEREHIASNLLRGEPNGEKKQAEPVGAENQADIEFIEVDLGPQHPKKSAKGRKGFLKSIARAVKNKRSNLRSGRSNELTAYEHTSPQKNERQERKRTLANRLGGAALVGALFIASAGALLSTQQNADAPNKREPVAAQTIDESTTTSVDNDTYSTIADAIQEIERIHDLKPGDTGFNETLDNTFELAAQS